MKRILIFSIRVYYIFIHPLLHQVFMSLFGVAPHCTHRESCSHYAIRRIQKDGTITGLCAALWRLRECHGFKK